MEDDILGFAYSDSSLPIKVDDRVRFDGHNGRVVKVCLSGSEDARTYSCGDTGGILIELDAFGLTLEPIGTYGDIVKIAE